MTRDERKTAKKAARAALVNPFQVGDLLSYSWGYDQTNLEFFQVVGTTRATVTVRKIRSDVVPGSQGFMSERRRPLHDAFLENSPAIRKVLQVFVDWQGKPGEVYLPMEFGSLRKSDGEAEYSSWYA
jgi:hypothetical protein